MLFNPRRARCDPQGRKRRSNIQGSVSAIGSLVPELDDRMPETSGNEDQDCA